MSGYSNSSYSIGGQLTRPSSVRIRARTALRAKREVTYKPLSDEPLLSTVYNVELCAVGIEYPLASGLKTFTPEDLIAAVASQDDPAVVAPRVWLGHPDDQRFHQGRTSPTGSAEPALGKIIGMRVEDEGMTLVGDIVGCPTWLAKILSSAYPNRSVEAFSGVTTVTGHTWGLVITDLALLGVIWPGVTTLADLEALYSENGPEGIEVEEGDVAVTASRAITAQVNIDDVRRAFVEALQAGALEGLSPWSWIRAMQIDPMELIVDDDETGEMFRVPFSVEGKAVSWEKPKKVEIKYVNASQKRDGNARKLLANMLTRDAAVVASWNSRAESRSDINEQEDPGMTPDQVRLLRARLGLTEAQLPDDATQDQINAALAIPSPDQTGASPTTGPGSIVNDPSQETGSQQNTVERPVAPSPDQQGAGPTVGPPGTPQDQQVSASAVPPGMTMVPTQAWTQMQAQVSTLATAHQASEAEGDAEALAAACRRGKVFPSQRAFYEAKLKDPKTRESFLHLLTASVDQGGLAENLVPVEARGSDPSSVDVASDSPTYPAEWLPEVHSGANVGDSPISLEG